VDVGGTAEVNGDLAYGPTASYNVGSEAQVSGDIIQLSEPRYFPPLPSFSVGTTSISVNANNSGSISPGSFKDITVKGTLLFGPGTYYIDSLRHITWSIVISDTTTPRRPARTRGQASQHRSSKAVGLYDGTTR
jgi:hypothetical protein